MADRRRFGRIRRLPSGRWQARYKGPDGADRPAPGTFVRKRDAQSWLVRKEAEILSGDWLDSDAGRVPFREYATAWVKERRHRSWRQSTQNRRERHSQIRRCLSGCSASSRSVNGLG